MLKLYCQDCGALNNYVSQKPNFCQKCGKPFGDASQQQETAASLGEKEVPASIPSMGGLDIDIDINDYLRSETVGALAGTQTSGDNSTTFLKGDPQIYTMEEFHKEAGSIKNHEKKET